MSKFIEPRLCIEEGILAMNPGISDEELLNLREKIYIDIWTNAPQTSCEVECYARNYYLYSRNRYV